MMHSYPVIKYAGRGRTTGHGVGGPRCQRATCVPAVQRLGSRRARMGPGTTRHLPRARYVRQAEHGRRPGGWEELWGSRERATSRASSLPQRRGRKGQRSRRTGKPCTRGGGPMAKAPRLWQDWSKGTQRTRKLSTVKAGELGQCAGTLQGILSWSRTAGAEPGAVKVARRVLNGGDEETCRVQRALSLSNCLAPASGSG
jgi:hypothetical protein